MIEAEYRARLEDLLYSLGLDGSTAEIVIENKVQDCETKSIYRGYSVDDAFDKDLIKGACADEY